MVGRLRSKVQIEPSDVDSRISSSRGTSSASSGWRGVGRSTSAWSRQASTSVRSTTSPSRTIAMAQLAHGGAVVRAASSTTPRSLAYEKGFRAEAPTTSRAALHYGGPARTASGKTSTRALAEYQAAKACWPHCTDQALAPQLRIAAILAQAGQADRSDDGNQVVLQDDGACVQAPDGARCLRKEARQPQVRGADSSRSASRSIRSCALCTTNSGEAYIKLGKTRTSPRLEFEVALAVPVELDRAHIAILLPRIAPLPDSAPDDLEARAVRCA